MQGQIRQQQGQIRQQQEQLQARIREQQKRLKTRAELQQRMREQAALQQLMDELAAVQQLMELKQRYWDQLFLATIEMSEPELRAALKRRSSHWRFTAAYVVGERLLEWPDDLIPLLDDKSEAVRQASRRSLMILSFLVLNPDEAKRIRSPRREGVATPLEKLTKPVDFGPNTGAKIKVRAQAANQWRDWWAGRTTQHAVVSRSSLTAQLKDKADETDGRQLAAVLLASDPKNRPEIVAKYRQGKGKQYTTALALASALESGTERKKLRKALRERARTMTVETLGQYLEDEDAEIRHAAALALAAKKSKAHLGKLAGLLLDPQPSVGWAAHSALCSLSGKDLGPRLNATEEEKTEAAKRWREWVESGQ